MVTDLLVNCLGGKYPDFCFAVEFVKMNIKKLGKGFQSLNVSPQENIECPVNPYKNLH